MDRAGDVTSPAPLSKAERVYRTLRERIGNGTYVGGYRLVLDKLARELDVSPVPVREAVRRLEAEGLVTFTRNVGAEVRGIDVDEYAEAMEALAYLEGAVTSLAGPHLTPDALARAEQINEQMRGLLGDDFDAFAFTHLNEQFHHELCAPCPNRHLARMVETEWRLMAMIRRSSFTAMPTRSAESVAEHDHLLHLLHTGAVATEVEAAARAHKLGTLDALLTARAASEPA
jgi:DNA-binding GntR family transcriptional regulator